MKNLFTLALIFFVSLGFTQSIPLTPSIVTYHQDTTSFRCAAVNGVDSLDLDFDADSLVDLRLKVYLTLDSCPQNMNPYLRRELTFNTFDSTYLLSNRNTVISQYIPQEFFPAQIVTPANFFDAEFGFVYQDFYRQISPTSCTAIFEGNMGQYAPYTYHFLAKKKRSGIDYYYLFGLQKNSNINCIRLRPPIISELEEVTKEESLNLYLLDNQLIVKSRMVKNLQLTVYDLGGRMVEQFNVFNGNGYRDLSNYASGVYLIRATKGNDQLGTFKVFRD